MYSDGKINTSWQSKILGMCHITGGGLDNISRINDNFQYVIDNPLPVQSVFDWLQDRGEVEDSEKYRTFNNFSHRCLDLVCS